MSNEKRRTAFTSSMLACPSSPKFAESKVAETVASSKRWTQLTELEAAQGLIDGHRLWETLPRKLHKH